MEQIGPYKILKRLGGGGFGEVWLGESPLRQVAIKVFNPKDENLIAFATSSNTEGLDVLRTRFLNEAKILAQLETNPHIVSVYEFGELDDGSPYYTMAYLPRSLTELLGKDVYDAAAVAELPENDRPRSLPLSDALNYLTQLLSGLAAAHKLGLVHRDIKPSNVMLGDDNLIRLVDFGIAKAPDGQHSTVSQLGMGSRNYMAPEQRESAKHVDARADVYAVGALAYRMITGRLPTGRFADPNVLVPELDAGISDLIVACLSEDKEQRPLDGTELASQFGKAINQQGQVDENATGTWVGDSGQSTIRDELKPLKTRIETALLAEGEIPASEYASLQTMAMIVDLDDAGLDALIETVSAELQPRLKPIRNLRRAIETKKASGSVSKDDVSIFFEMAKQVGWSEDKVNALLQDGTQDEAIESEAEPADQEATASVTKEQKVAPTASSQSSPEPIAAEPTKSSGSRWGALVVLVLVIVGGGYGYTAYQDQQEQERIAEQQEREKRIQALELKRQNETAWADAKTEDTLAAYKAYTQLSFATENYKREANKRIEGIEEARSERDRLAKLEADRKAKAERDRLAKLESDRKAKAERDRLAKLESDRKAAEASPRPGREFKDCSDCPEMVVIPAGTFRMGDLIGGGNADEKPVHSVTVKSFALGKTEVTFAEYDVFASATNRSLPKDEGWGRGSRPVIHVNWEDATAYSAWLSKKTGKSYRLPSESEWEYAARAGSTKKYSWGNDIGRNNAVCNGCGSQWDAKQTAPVGSFKANDFGLLDMHGNVFEWTQDCWNGSYAGAPSDGSAWTRRDCNRRVLRGGSWFYIPGYLRSASRVWFTASTRFNISGFRVAQDL
jgi:formylglycine-generating enzyme required for sulfatase activity/serine/threonine protein kinase